MLRPINISVSPNLEADDVWLALKTLLRPPDPDALLSLGNWFQAYFGQTYRVFPFNAGRSALYAILQAAGIASGDEVIVQAFTCVAVPNSVLWLKAKPVYADILPLTYNLDPRSLEQKLTPKTKAVIVQHTFGIPAPLDQIRALCRRRRLLLIEDCAHALGGSFNGQKLGTWGDAACFSFGRDKIISAVFGGAALTRDKRLAAGLARLSSSLPSPRPSWVTRQLLHPLITAAALSTYNCFNLGKVLLLAARKLNLQTLPVSPLESRGGQPADFPASLPPQLAVLALNQLRKLARFNRRRRRIAAYYFSRLPRLGLPAKLRGAVYLRFPLQLDNPYRLYRKAKAAGILLGNWYGDIITPAAPYAAVGYRLGDCPRAEAAARRIINLPTYPLLRRDQVFRLTKLIRQWLV